MEREEVKKIVVSVIEERLDDINGNEDCKLADDLAADSLDFVEICMDLERGFNVRVTDEEAEDLFNDNVTVRDVVDFFHKKKNTSEHEG